MNTQYKTPRKKAGKLVKATAILCGFGAVGMFASAALDWVQSRGDVTTSQLNYGMELVPAGFTASETNNADTVILEAGSGFTVGPELANYTASVISATDLTWQASVTDAYPGLLVDVTAPHKNTGAEPLKLQSISVVDPGTGLPFAAGTAPAVPVLLNASPFNCSSPAVVTDAQATLKLGAMLTDQVGAPFQVVAQFVPAALQNLAACEASVVYPATTAAP